MDPDLCRREGAPARAQQVVTSGNEAVLAGPGACLFWLKLADTSLQPPSHVKAVYHFATISLTTRSWLTSSPSALIADIRCVFCLVEAGRPLGFRQSCHLSGFLVESQDIATYKHPWTIIRVYFR